MAFPQKLSQTKDFNLPLRVGRLFVKVLEQLSAHPLVSILSQMDRLKELNGTWKPPSGVLPPLTLQMGVLTYPG